MFVLTHIVLIKLLLKMDGEMRSTITKVQMVDFEFRNRFLISMWFPSGRKMSSDLVFSNWDSYLKNSQQ